MKTMNHVEWHTGRIIIVLGFFTRERNMVYFISYVLFSSVLNTKYSRNQTNTYSNIKVTQK